MTSRKLYAIQSDHSTIKPTKKLAGELPKQKTILKALLCKCVLSTGLFELNDMHFFWIREVSRK